MKDKNNILIAGIIVLGGCFGDNSVGELTTLDFEDHYLDSKCVNDPVYVKVRYVDPDLIKRGKFYSFIGDKIEKPVPIFYKTNTCEDVTSSIWGNKLILGVFHLGPWLEMR